MWGCMWGYLGQDARETNALPDRAMKGWCIWQGYVDACSGNACARLEQTQLCCAFDGRPAIRDVEFTVDALGMCADRAQGDHEFLGDLRPRKLGFEQSEHCKLTLAERLYEC